MKTKVLAIDDSRTIRGLLQITLEDAVRFLTDHLDGDRYFTSGDNRARARAQLRLAEVFWQGQEQLRAALEGARG